MELMRRGGPRSAHLLLTCIGRFIMDSRLNPTWLLTVAVVIAASWPFMAAVAQSDDVEWQIIKPSNTGIPGEEARVLRFAPDGNLWVGARWPFWQEGGIGVYNDAEETWSVWSNWETPIPSEYIHDIEFGPDGVVWIATANGLIRKNDEDWHVYNASNSPLLHNVVRSIELESNGALWINNTNTQNTNAALFRLEGTPGQETWNIHAVPTIPFSEPWRQLDGLFVDSQDHVWVGNMVLAGAARYDGRSWSIVPGSTNDLYKFITEDHQGNIWLIAGNLGYSFYKYDGSSFTSYNAGNTPFGQTTITTMAVDDDGTIYVGNWSGHVIRSTNAGQSWSTYLTGLNIIWGIAPDPNSTTVWIRTIGAIGQFRHDGQWLRDFNSYNTGMPWYWVDRFNLDQDGNMWLATGEAGLSRFDGERWRNWGNHNVGSEPYPFAGNEPMGAFYLDSAGTGWMGGNGIARWEPDTGEFTAFWNWQNNPGMGVTLFTSFAEDGNNQLFAASKYGHVMRFDGSLWQSLHNVYLPSGSMPAMARDTQNSIWAAGAFAVSVWDGDAWSQLPLPYSDYFFDLGGITALAIDGSDRVWFGTNDGLVLFDGTTFARYHIGNSPLPAKQVQGVDVRSDGLIGVSAHEFGPATPFPSGVALIDGDPDYAANWRAFEWGEPGVELPHYQLGEVMFDALGRLWISTLSEGVAVLTPPASAVPGDLNDDGAVDGMDLMILLAAWGECSKPDVCPADLNDDGTVDGADLLALLSEWS